MAEGAERARWGHTARLGQCVFIAMTGKQPDAKVIAPAWVFGQPAARAEVAKKLTPEMEAKVWDLWMGSLGLPVPIVEDEACH